MLHFEPVDGVAVARYEEREFAHLTQIDRPPVETPVLELRIDNIVDKTVGGMKNQN